MRVLFLNQFFPPDLAPSGRLIRELGEDLVARGEEVLVVTSRAPYARAEARLPRREWLNGIAVYRTTGWDFGRQFGLGRLLGYAVFCAGALARAARLRRLDLVVVRWTPAFLPAVGVLLRRFRTIRLVNWVHDLYPEYAVATGLVRPGSALHRLFDRLSMTSLREADHVVAISEPMAARIRGKGVPAARVSVIPDWADGKALHPVPRAENHFRRRHGLGAASVGMYAGNMGIGHEFDTLLDALGELSEREDCAFLFVGDGHQKDRLVGEVARRRLTSVRFLPYVPEAELAHCLGAGDIHFITLRGGLEGIMMPNKIYGVMACARPVLYIGPPAGEVATIVRAARCGVAVSPGDVKGAVEGWETLTRDPALGESWGANGRRFFEAHHNRPQLTQRFHQLLRALL